MAEEDGGISKRNVICNDGICGNAGMTAQHDVSRLAPQFQRLPPLGLGRAGGTLWMKMML